MDPLSSSGLKVFDSASSRVIIPLKYKSFKEFQRLQNKWKEQKKKKKLTNEDLMALALRAGAFMHKNGITTKEITAYSNTLLEKHNLDEE